MARIRLDFTQEEVEKALIDYWTEKHNMREKGSRFMRMGDKYPEPTIIWNAPALSGCALVIGTDKEPYKPYFEVDGSDEP